MCLIMLLTVAFISDVARAAPPLTTKDCLNCHNMTPTAAQKAEAVSLYVNARLFQSSVHASLGCTSCHSDIEAFPHIPKPSRVACGKCHVSAENDFGQSIHALKWDMQKLKYPACLNCHGNPHGIAKVQTAVWQTRIGVATCGTCHKERLRSYWDTFHGQVTGLGFVATAQCWSCHENHGILSSSDPASSIAPQNLIATCSKCHHGVTRSFVTFEPHPNPHDRGLNPTLYYTALAMNLLLLSVFAFFGLHTLLWLVRSWFEKNHNSAASQSGRRE